MNIDKFILPRFKRFRTVHIGIKRLLFVLTFPIFITSILAFIYCLFEMYIGPSYLDADVGAGISFVLALSYLVFWTLVRIVIWVYDGFVS
ncbi:hypothetical protein SAMN06295967_102228 [Belliella buryatensis]|uniref:Uncharacterized protein n=1 Tax=Belliella buryatensis TaxID=1500549 RepID=A0A239BCA1_9BACT|nr:hypothetical protein [Belliella buryatensis]SNS04623.1 hypothetical protein SAMN06295967_102228 [Belliella buryatensis]